MKISGLIRNLMTMMTNEWTLFYSEPQCSCQALFLNEFIFSFYLLESWKLPGGHKEFKRGFEDTFQTPLSVKDVFKTSLKPPCACWVYGKYSSMGMFESFIKTCDRNLVLVQTSNKLSNYTCVTIIQSTAQKISAATLNNRSYTDIDSIDNPGCLHQVFVR